MTTIHINDIGDIVRWLETLSSDVRFLNTRIDKLTHETAETFGHCASNKDTQHVVNQLVSRDQALDGDIKFLHKRLQDIEGLPIIKIIKDGVPTEPEEEEE